MTLFRLIIKSMLHFRRQHFALFLGTVLSTAVLTGALITGDSVDYSLRRMVDLRLGKTGFALETGDRFVGENLAPNLSQKLSAATAAIFRSRAIASNPSSGTRVNKIEVLGIDADFLNLSEIEFPQINRGEVVISENLAEKLALGVGDDLILRMDKASIIPVNAPFAEENGAAEPWRLRIISIADDARLGRFSLQSNQVAPYNAFVARDFLAEKSGVSNLANLILIENKKDLSVGEINRAFDHSWELADAGLKISLLNDSHQLQLTSNRIFIDPAVANAIQKIDIAGQPVLTYLVNSISLNGKNTPYSFVSAGAPPNASTEIKSGEIIINSWLAQDIEAQKGDSLILEYFVVGNMRKLDVKSKVLAVKEIVPLDDSPASRALMPDFPGMANAGSCSEWNTGVPIDLEKIRDKDEKYWDDYRGKPKAYVSIIDGEKIWANTFGSFTAYRFPEHGISEKELSRQILAALSPRDLGLQFRHVRQEGVGAVANAVDFGELFLSLSFFVIAAGVLLTALLYSLHIASRNREAGVLAAIGFSRRKIVKFRMLEALLVIIAGSVAGAFAGVLYNRALMLGLNSVWQDVVRTSVLWVHVEPSTLFTGILSGIIIATTTIFLITRSKSKEPVKVMISKSPSSPINYPEKKYLMNTLIIIFAFGLAIALVVYSLCGDVDQNAGLFLPAGGLFLLGGIASIFRIMVKGQQHFHTLPLSWFQLSLKNAGRNRVGSISTIALLALGTFTIMITGANQQTFYGVSNDRSSGTGGFSMWVENAVPIIYDLNTHTGKEKYGLEDDPVFENVKFLQFHSLEGDDASCLNLNQVDRPRVLGVDAKIFDANKSFSFASLHKSIDASRPWLSLDKKFESGVIPAFADQTVITWGLMKKVGDTLTYLNEQGNPIKLLLAGGLKNSIFQGNILIADSIFMANYPSAGGTEIMLVETPADEAGKVTNILEERLTDYGLEITSTKTRLATFNSVTNTYLSVFMILGGLGVLIGTIGLGIVLLRNIMERKAELALLLAIGFRKTEILKTIFLENFILLLAGNTLGFFAALIGILPSLLSPAFAMNTRFIILLILMVFISGLLWIYFPARQSLKRFSIKDLHEE